MPATRYVPKLCFKTCGCRLAPTGPQVTPGRAATPGADDPVQKYADSRIDRDLKQAVAVDSRCSRRMISAFYTGRSIAFPKAHFCTIEQVRFALISALFIGRSYANPQMDERPEVGE